MHPLRRGRSEPKVGRGGDSSWGRGWGRARTRFHPRSRLRPSPGVGRGGDRLPRLRLRPSPGVGRGGDHRPRSRLRLSLGVGQGGDHLLRSRRGPSPGVGWGGGSCGAWGWTRLLSASPWRVAQQSEQGRRRCFPVSSVSGGAKWLRSLRPCWLRNVRQDKVSGNPCIECSCDTVGWRGDLAKVASLRSLSELGLGRVEGVPVAWGGVWICLGLLFLPEAGLEWGEIASLEWTEPWPELRPSGSAACADGDHQPSLRVLGVPLIMVPDRVERDPVFVTTSTGIRFFRTEPR
jgi:hypothetical protein